MSTSMSVFPQQLFYNKRLRVPLMHSEAERRKENEIFVLTHVVTNVGRFVPYQITNIMEINFISKPNPNPNHRYKVSITSHQY